MPEELPDPDSIHYWDGVSNSELRYQLCNGCKSSIFYPRSICPACGSSAICWKVSSGLGKIYACTTVYRAPPKYKDKVPYIVALIDLDEDYRMMSEIINFGEKDVSVGKQVKVIFRDDIDGKLMPYFTPID